MPYPTLTMDAAFLSTPKAWMRGGGSRSDGPPMSKFWSDLCNIWNGFRKHGTDYVGHTAVSELPSNGRKGPGGPRMCLSRFGIAGLTGWQLNQLEPSIERMLLTIMEVVEKSLGFEGYIRYERIKSREFRGKKACDKARNWGMRLTLE